MIRNADALVDAKIVHVTNFGDAILQCVRISSFPPSLDNKTDNAYISTRINRCNLIIKSKAVTIKFVNFFCGLTLLLFDMTSNAVLCFFVGVIFVACRTAST